jgi:hypothetical protein
MSFKIQVDITGWYRGNIPGPYPGVICSNLGRNNGYSDWIFYGFLSDPTGK